MISYGLGVGSGCTFASLLSVYSYKVLIKYIPTIKCHYQEHIYQPFDVDSFCKKNDTNRPLNIPLKCTQRQLHWSVWTNNNAKKCLIIKLTNNRDIMWRENLCVFTHFWFSETSVRCLLSVCMCVCFCCIMNELFFFSVYTFFLSFLSSLVSRRRKHSRIDVIFFYYYYFNLTMAYFWFHLPINYEIEYERRVLAPTNLMLLFRRMDRKLLLCFVFIFPYSMWRY